MPESLGYTTETYNYDQLLAGSSPVVSRSVILLSGENRSRGALLGKVTASGKYKLSLAGAIDGSEAPDAILGKDTDASAGDQETIIYLSGEYNEESLTYGTGHTKDSVRDGLRDKNIYLKAPVKK